MSDTDQAQADLQEDEMVADPLDTANSTNSGTSELAEYEKEIFSVLDAPEDEAQGDEPAEEDSEDEEQEESTEQASEQEEDPSDVEGDSEDEETSNTSNRFRIRAKDEVEAEALALRKRHPDWSLEKCLASAKTVLGVDEDTNGREVEQAETGPTIDQQLKELRTRHKEATSALEFEAAAEIFEQIEELRDQQVKSIVVEMQEESRVKQQNEQSYNDQWEESKRKALTFYPDSGKAETAFFNRMVEINEFMRDNGDPQFNSPDKPFLLSKMAAAELGIPMARPAAKTSAKTSSKSPVQPASGNARTTATPPPAAKLDERLARVDSVEDYEKLVGQYVEA